MDNWSIYYRIGSFSVPKNRKKRGDAILQGGSLTIYDTEEAYVEALSDYLNKNMELGVVTVAFSNLDKFIEYLEKNQPSYVFVCEDFDKHILKGKIDEDRIISLITAKDTEYSGPWIYKYQSAKAITKELSAAMLIKEESILLGDSNIHILFSTKSSIEREEYANVLINDLKNKGSVLYIDMDPYNSRIVSGYEGHKGMSELIYYLKQGGEKLKWKFKTLIEKEEISGRILPVGCPLDLSELTKEDTGELIKILQNLNEYDCILINLGILTPATFELMKAGKHIEIVVTRKNGDRESAEKFINYLQLMGMADVERRVEIIEFGTDTWL